MTSNKKHETPAKGTAIVPPPDVTALAELTFEGDEGAGYDNQTMADRKLPMFVVLQANSPQIVESKGKYHAGQILNTVSGEVMDELEFVPAITDHCFTEWVPRDDGGGFRGRHPTSAKVVRDAIARNDGRAIGKLPVPQPNDKAGKPQPTHELVETFEVYAITHKEREITGFGVISCSSTKIKSYKGWNTQLSMFAPKIGEKSFRPGEIPLFAHRVRMTTELEQNAKGSYFVPVFSPAMGGDDLMKSMIGQKDPRYQAAKKLREDVKNGLAKAAYETMTQDAGPDPEAGVPF